MVAPNVGGMATYTEAVLSAAVEHPMGLWHRHEPLHGPVVAILASVASMGRLMLPEEGEPAEHMMTAERP